MFHLFNKRTHFSIAPLLQVDIHSHLLPGIDDGSEDVATSLELIDGMIDLGFKQLICTPHVMSDLYPNTHETIHAAYIQLRTVMEAKGYTIPIHYAAEYLIDEGFEEKVEQGLLCLHDNFVLVETMFSLLPPNIEDILFLLRSKGYKPILAHPERYHFMDESLEALSVFEKHGCYLQPNILSFTGYYGKREKALAERLLSKGKVDFLGTDMHHRRHLKHIEHLQLRSNVIKKLEAVALMNPLLKKEEKREVHYN